MCKILQFLTIKKIWLYSYFIDHDDNIRPPKVDFSAPPPYDVAANSKLPTYEEVQREKHILGEDPPLVLKKI